MPVRLAGVLLLSLGLLALPLPVQAREWYVSIARGKGKDGTQEKPAKDMGNISGQVEAGDVIHVAAGVYTSKGDQGYDEFDVPVSIIGGWNDAFTERDPWGSSQTVLSGVNVEKNFKGRPRLSVDLQKYRKRDGPLDVVVDGLIIDNGGRNQYDDKGLKISRMFKPKTQQNATPDSAGLLVKGAKLGTVTVRNCVVANVGARTGAMSIWGSEATKLTVENNLMVNNTGIGLETNSWFKSKDDKQWPSFVVRNNTVLLTWKYDAYASDSGDAFKMDKETHIVAEGNVFALSDQVGVNNIKKSPKMVLKNNLITQNVVSHYKEFDTVIALADIEDEAELLGDGSGNVDVKIKVPMTQAWAASYAARELIDRNAAEANVKVKGGWQNDVRSMLGLPLQGTDIKADSDVWLHRMDLGDALKTGQSRYEAKYGCQAPGKLKS